MARNSAFLVLHRQFVHPSLVLLAKPNCQDVPRQLGCQGLFTVHKDPGEDGGFTCGVRGGVCSWHRFILWANSDASVDSLRLDDHVGLPTMILWTWAWRQLLFIDPFVRVQSSRRSCWANTLLAQHLLDPRLLLQPQCRGRRVVPVGNSALVQPGVVTAIEQDLQVDGHGLISRQQR